MHKDSINQDQRAGSVGAADEARREANGADDNLCADENKNTPASGSMNDGNASEAERLHRQWRREIAKKAASARWQRGD